MQETGVNSDFRLHFLDVFDFVDVHRVYSHHEVVVVVVDHLADWRVDEQFLGGDQLRLDHAINVDAYGGVEQSAPEVLEGFVLFQCLGAEVYQLVVLDVGVHLHEHLVRVYLVEALLAASGQLYLRHDLLRRTEVLV